MVEAASEFFDARFSALRRHYLYRIISRRAPLALEAGKRLVGAEDARSRGHACRRRKTLVGRHDFTTFRSAHCQANSPVRTLDRLDVTRSGDLIEIRATAQSFLHNQIRSFAGTLKLAGEGKWTPDDVRAALEARDRKACGPVAPPDGLYFMQVDYPTSSPTGARRMNDRRRCSTATDLRQGDESRQPVRPRINAEEALQVFRQHERWHEQHQGERADHQALAVEDHPQNARDRKDLRQHEGSSSSETTPTSCGRKKTSASSSPLM